MNICPEHGKLTADLGEIKGTVIMLREDVQGMSLKIDSLITKSYDSRIQTAKDIAVTRRDTAIDRMKWKPIYWIIGITSSFVILRFLESVYRVLVK